MFSPAVRRSDLSHRDAKTSNSPSTPALVSRRSIIPNRPVTGTPAPWQSSVPSRPGVENNLQFHPEVTPIGSSKHRGDEIVIPGTSLGGAALTKFSVERSEHGDKHKAPLTFNVHKTSQDEESESIISHLFQEFLVSGHASDSVVKLQKSGAFERSGEANIFAHLSKCIVDTLAKHWTSTRGAEIVAATVISSQLADKQQKHMKFLQFLGLSKCHEELYHTQSNSLQIIMEHGEKLACMIRMRELQNIISERGANSLDSDTDLETSHSLLNLIQLAGETVHKNSVFLIDRDNAEVFYSKVSEVEEVFRCLDNHIERLIDAEDPFLVQVQRACELSNICVTLIQAATCYRNEHNVWYPPAEGLKPWYCVPVVLKGMWRLALVLIQLSKEKNKFDELAKPELFSHLEPLSELLLDSYVIALTANMESKEEQKGLLEEYHDARDRLFGCLYDQFKYISQLGYQENYQDDEEKKTMLKKLSSGLLLIARRHESYQTLWQMCCDFNDQALLENLMKEGTGHKGGFSCFVFMKLMEEKQLPKLVRLGEEFPEELALFLKRHPNLLWLHQVLTLHFSAASDTLHVLALSQAPETRESLLPEAFQPTLQKRRHLFNLAKIAAAAGNDVGHVTKMKRIDADLRILELQEQIMASLEKGGEVGPTAASEGRLFQPLDLIEACLSRPEEGLVLHAFGVFACTGSSFRAGNRGRLAECWRAAAGEDDWERIQEVWAGAGGGDRDLLRAVEGTVLFQASRMCYGPGARVVEPGFEEAFPVRAAAEGSDDEDDGPSSVEEVVLRLHGDYPKAVKLMLTAVALGAGGGECGPAADGGEARGSEMSVE